MLAGDRNNRTRLVEALRMDRNIAAAYSIPNLLGYR